MTAEDREPIEGRTRGLRPLLAGAIGLALVAALPLVWRLSSDDPVAPGPAPGPTGGPSDRDPGATAETPDLHGRLVYTTVETEGFPQRPQRLMVLDLATGRLDSGPLVPSVEDLWVAEGGTLILVADDAGARGIAYAVTDLSPDAGTVEIARGDVLSLTSDGTSLLVGRTGAAPAGSGCDRVFALALVPVADPQDERRLGRGCGELISGVHHVWAVVSVVVDGRLFVQVSGRRPGAPSTLFDDLAVVSVSPHGTFLFADPEQQGPKGRGVWPRSPTGPLLVWPGSGTPRPLVRGARLFSQRVIAWSPSGGDVVVSGIVGEERNLWRVYVPAGTAQPLLPPNSFPLRSVSAGATFDDAGNAFAGSPGTIVVSSDVGVFPVSLPADAPSPEGPVAWLP